MQSVSTGAGQVNYYANEMLSIQDRQDPKKVGAQVEALFYMKFLEQMRSGKLAEDLFSSPQTNSIQQMHDQQLASYLGGAGHLGIADLIAAQMEQNKEGGADSQPSQIGLIKERGLS